jgi:subtilisin family serine protease
MALYSGLSFGVPLASGEDRLLGSALASVSNYVAKPIVGAPSRFLWDENGHGASEPSARGAKGFGPVPSIQKSPLEVDHEMPAYRQLLLSRFLWEGSDQDAKRGDRSPRGPVSLARYLWGEPADRSIKQGAAVETALARYLWDEPKQAEQGHPALAHFLWREFAPTEPLMDGTESYSLRDLTRQDQNFMAYGDLHLASVASAPLTQGASEWAPAMPVSSEVPLSISARAADRVNAYRLHEQGITGRGVGVAIIDTGLWDHAALTTNTEGEPRVKVFFDATKNQVQTTLADDQGHGSHITSVLASSRQVQVEASDDQGVALVESRFEGIAPDADLIVVKAFDDQSRANYVDVVRAIDFVIQHRDQYNIRVLNLAFQGQAMTHYWDDPINQAVMAAWDAGIAVVVSSGNSGPGAMTLGAPANVPYVITVGAMTDAYTPDDVQDDYLAPFSAFGPTLEGFAKPEMVAPGGHLQGLVPNGSTLSETRPEFHQRDQDYLVSGTSQAAAVVSGLAALALQADPTLTPDDLKCRLMLSSQGYVMGDLQGQGTGLVDGLGLLASRASGCANQGLDLAADLARTQRFMGPLRELNPASLVAESMSRSLFNAATAVDPAVLARSLYVDMNVMQSLGFDWSEETLKDRGYWVGRAKLPSPQAFAADAPLESKALAGLMSKLLPVNGFEGTALDPVRVSGFIWNLSAPESAGFIWNLSAPESAGFIWNLSAPESAGFIWNLSTPESAGFIWNLAAPESAGFIWNLSAPESAGFIWNLSAPESAGFIWNLSAPKSAGFIWNLSAPESAGFIWNL